MGDFRQIIAVTYLGFSSLHTRVKPSLVIVAGLACVIVVLLSILSLWEGLALAYLGAGHADRAIVLSLGAPRESSSSLPRAWIPIIQDAPGIRRTAGGAPLADAEIQVGVHLAKKSNRSTGATSLVGLGPEGFALSPELKLVEGRMLRPGKREVIVGRTAQAKFAGLELGDKVRLQDGDWPIAGVFATDSTLDGDLIADSRTLMAALRRGRYNAVIVQLESVQAFDAFRRALTGNPILSVSVERQSDYWQRMVASLPQFPVITAYFLGFLIGIGAVTGTLNTMHAAVSSREREIAILRAMGFGGFAVAVSVVLEAMLLAAIGAVIGTAIDYLWLDGYAYNGGLDGGVFRVAVTPHLLVIAIGWALVIALIGALSPAVKAARLTVVEALRGV